MISTFFVAARGRTLSLLALSHLFCPFDTVRVVESRPVCASVKVFSRTVCEFDCRLRDEQPTKRHTVSRSQCQLPLINTVLIALDQHPALTTQYFNYYRERAMSLSLIFGLVVQLAYLLWNLINF